MANRDIQATLRVSELQRLFQFRCGRFLPRDDEGRDYIAIMADHLMLRPDGRKRLENFLELKAPWLTAAELEALIAARQQSPRYWTAAELGVELNLSFEHRTSLAITTIRPADLTPAELAERNRARKAARERERRRQKAASARSDAATDLNGFEGTLRQRSILIALQHAAGWQSAADLRLLVEAEPCWQTARGRRLPAETLRRLINREIGALLVADVIEARTVLTKWRSEAREVRLRNGAPRDFVPAQESASEW